MKLSRYFAPQKRGPRDNKISYAKKSAMDTSVEADSEPIKEEEPDYEDESAEWSEDSETITIKVEPTVSEPAMLDISESTQERLENDIPVAYPTHLLDHNPAHFYIAELSQKLNSKLNKVLSPQSHYPAPDTVELNYFVSENLIGGEALQCQWCPANATNLAELKQHELVCSLSPSSDSAEQSNIIDEDGVQRRYVCDICGKRFARIGFLKRHYILHSNSELYTCVVCKANFPSLKILKDHQITHLKDMPYICSKCNRGFPSREALRVHAPVHIKDMPFSCRFCGKRFMQAKSLNFHLKVHSGFTIYPCDECEKSFDTEEERAAHKKQHNVIMPYKCEFCNQSFQTKRQRQKHTAQHDVENPQKCIYCDKKFALEAAYKEHIKEIHSNVASVCVDCELLAKSVTCDESEEFMCEDCDLPFLHKKCLANHITNHPKGEKLPCEKCGKKFFLVSAYHRHMLIHTGERPFTCTDCRCCFLTRTHLKDHMREHWRDRPFACKVCGEKFSFNNMMTHLLSHAKGKNILKETGNTRGDLKDKGRTEGLRRSLRPRKSCNTFYEGTSDEFENSDGL